MRIRRLSLLMGLVSIFLLTGITEAATQETEEAEVIEAIDVMRLYERAALLRRGKKVLRVGFAYHHDSANTFIGHWWGERRASGRSITLGLRYGLLRDIEMSIDVPFVFREETEIVGGWSLRRSGEGLGDIGFGIRYEALREGRLLWGRFLSPSVILGVNYKSDMGKSPYDALGVDELPVGSGHRNVGFELTISRIVDPVLIYGLGQYTVVLKREHDNINYDSGDIFNWSLGMGFSVNPWVSIGGGVGGSVASEFEIDGEKIVGSDRTSFHTFSNLTYTISEKLRFTVRTTLGINEEATDFALSSAIFYTF